MATGSSTLVEVGSDGGLVLATLAGDQTAFASLYDRFAGRIHDFHLALLRDPYQAVEATYQTIRKAVAGLNHLGEPAQLRPWLYALAHRQAKQHRNPNKKSRSDGAYNWAGGARPSIDGQADMWRALPSDLTERDRALLTLHLRHGLDATEIASIVGISAGKAKARLDRLRPALEPALRPLLQARLGPAYSNRDGSGFGLIDSVEGMPTGRADRSGAGGAASNITNDDNPPPLRLAVPFVPPPPQLRDEILRHTPLITAHEGLPRPRTRAAWITTVVTVIVLVVGTVLFVNRNMERRPVIAVKFGPSSELALSTTVIDLGAVNSTATVTLSNTGQSQLSWNATPTDPWLKVSPANGSLAGGAVQQLTVTVDRNALPEGDGRTQLKVGSAGDQGQGMVGVALREERPPAIMNARASNTKIGGYGCPTTSTISATVQDESKPVHVTLVGPGRQSQVMKANGDTFTGRLGSGSGTNIIWRIVATDARNNTVTSPAQVISHADCAVRPAPKPKPVPSQAPQSSQNKPDPTTRPGDSDDDSGSDGRGSSGSGDDSGDSGGSSGGDDSGGDSGGSSGGDDSGDSGGGSPFGGF
ncbi:BACON domain-containing protein [Pseudonocardia spinosispora]|uniref:BACON domain-containing protein n=1 Tax=Pseudonocardia spinosispora TaxID=103441 RepID=UPI000416A53F|nr:hypothetical protein [Pseudonocardia spinosispora]